MTNNFTLLYVEDDTLVRENFTEIFKTYFHKVISTDNGDEALKLYEHNKIDVAILDVNIYGLDGISVASRIREEKSEEDLIILMISAYSDREKLIRAINLQLFGYLIKPVENKKLFSTLNDMVTLLTNRNLISLTQEYKWNDSSTQLLHNDKELKLTKNETQAIKILIQNKNSYMSACDIQYDIFKEKAIERNNCNNIVQLLSRLKKKVEILYPTSNYFIENCYGVGYRITIK